MRFNHAGIISSGVALRPGAFRRISGLSFVGTNIC